MVWLGCATGTPGNLPTNLKVAGELMDIRPESYSKTIKVHE